MRKVSLLGFAFVPALVAIGCGSGSSASDTVAVAVPFSQVQAVMSDRCAGCHGGPDAKAGVALDSYAAIMKGGPKGPIVKAGDPAASELVQVMKGAEGHKRMPPMGPPATEAQIKTVSDWIQAGAKNG